MKTKIKSTFQIVIVIIVIILCAFLVKNILKISGSSQKITNEKTNVENLKKENADLQKQLESVKGTQFIESVARDKLGLAKSGDIVVVLPDEATLKSLAPKLPEETFSLPVPIWQRWLKLFL